MGGGASAAQAAVRAHASGGADTGPATNQGTFEGRQVSESPAGERLPSVAERKRELADHDAGEAAKRTRLEAAAPRGSASGTLAPAAPRALSAAVSLVSRIESDIERADTLLKRSRRELLTPTEWSQLSGLLFTSVGQNISAFLDRWDDGPGRLLHSGAQSPSDSERLRTLRGRFDAAYNYFYSDRMPWEDSVRRIHSVLPGTPVRSVMVESRIVPGTALGSVFADAYPAEEDTGENRLDWYRHVPDLAQTVLVDAEGQTLFSGVFHRLVRPGPFDGGPLVGVPVGELEDLVDALFFPEGGRPMRYDRHLDVDHLRALHFPAASSMERYVLMREARELPDLGRARVVEAIARELSLDSEIGKRYTRDSLLHLSLTRKAEETVAAALAADPDKFQRAFDAGTVDLDLFSIQVLKQNNSGTFDAASYAQYCIAIEHPPTLHMRRQDGLARSIKANIKFRQFNVYVPESGPGWIGRGGEPESFNDLLGPRHSPELGGIAKRRVDAMVARISELHGNIKALGWQSSRTGPTRQADHGQVLATRSRLVNLNNEMERLKRNAITLQEAASQLKALVTERIAWPSGADGYRSVMARCALFAHLMGGTPIVSCASGRHENNQMAAEINLLATCAVHLQGHLPPLGEGPEQHPERSPEQ